MLLCSPPKNSTGSAVHRLNADRSASGLEQGRQQGSSPRTGEACKNIKDQNFEYKKH